MKGLIVQLTETEKNLLALLLSEALLSRNYDRETLLALMEKVS